MSDNNKKKLTEFTTKDVAIPLIAEELHNNYKNLFGDDEEKYDENLIEAVASKIFNNINTFTKEEGDLINDFMTFNEENLNDNDSNTPFVYDIL